MINNAFTTKLSNSMTFIIINDILTLVMLALSLYYGLERIGTRLSLAFILFYTVKRDGRFNNILLLCLSTSWVRATFSAVEADEVFVAGDFDLA